MTHPVRVAFRTGGGSEIGLGHVLRCLTLAKALRDRKVDCLFLLDGDQAVFDLVLASGFQLSRIHPSDDLLETHQQCKSLRIGMVVADSYVLTPSYINGLRDAGFAVTVLDDLGDRDLPAHLVVNGSAGAENIPYESSQKTKFLLGPKYILLRPEFLQVPIRPINDYVEHVMVTVGGSDPHALTGRLMGYIAEALGPVQQDVVVGPLFRDVDAIRAMANEASGTITLHESAPNMKELMLQADLVLCGGGQTTYELAALGTPAIAIQTAKNQMVNLTGLSIAETLKWCGDVHEENLASKLIDELQSLAGDVALRKSLSRRGPSLVDGGGAVRVTKAVLELMESNS